LGKGGEGGWEGGGEGGEKNITTDSCRGTCESQAQQILYYILTRVEHSTLSNRSESKFCKLNLIKCKKWGQRIAWCWP